MPYYAKTSGRPVQMDKHASGCRLVRRAAPSPEPPALDEGQQRVVSHRGGPLLALARLGGRAGRDDWVAAGQFLDRYAARFDLAPVPAYDYAEIVRIAARLLGQSAARDRERQAYDFVLVDEYQDTDPAQEALLHA